MNEMVNKISDIINDGFCKDISSDDIAKKILEAMKEPTEKMLTQGTLAFVACDEEYQPNATYKAMIQAALDDV